MAWLSGWSYRKEITITGQSGAGTNYQVKFNIGDSAGGDFHLEGNCTNFPQDIEVTDNDGTTLLKFWIVDLTADPLRMWIKVADDLGSNQTIYVYYGKSGATTNSNISNTFINGWDFEGDTIGNPPTGWVEDDANGDFHVIAGKKVNLLHANTDASLSNNYASITSITGNNDRIIEFDFESNRTDEYNYIILNDGTAHATEGIFLSIHSGNLYYYSGGWNSLIAVSINTIYHVKVYNIDLTNDQFDIDVDTVNKGTNLGFGAVQASLDYIHIEGGGGEDCDSEYDNIIIRKQTSPEPAFSSAGSEETPTAGNPYWYYQMLRRRN